MEDLGRLKYDKFNNKFDNITVKNNKDGNSEDNMIEIVMNTTGCTKLEAMISLRDNMDPIEAIKKLK